MSIKEPDQNRASEPLAKRRVPEIGERVRVIIEGVRVAPATDDDDLYLGHLIPVEHGHRAALCVRLTNVVSVEAS